MSFRMKKLDAYPVYLILSAGSSLFYGLVFSVNMIYQATVVNLDPLQLVLVGTTLETAVFLFEVPTGVVADVISRRLSIIIGLCLIGAGFLVEGAIPIFAAVLASQVLWGVGYTFTSGATEAWIADELGEARAGQAFLRGSQAGSIAGIAALIAAVALGSLALNLPILLGGGLFVGLGLFLALFMPENGFKPTPREDRSTWQSMLGTFRDGLRLVRGRPVLMSILGIGVVRGLFSEGFDRLSTPHLLRSFTFPQVDGLQPVFWLGLIGGVGMLLSTAATEIVRRRLDTTNHLAVARTLLALNVVLIGALIGFALTPTLLLAVIALWVVGVLRHLDGPLSTAWTNQHVEPGVRATIFSLAGQVDAIGQIAGGPAVGAVGSALSIRAALATSGLLLTPALWLYRRVIRRGAAAVEAEAVVEPGAVVGD